jgi:hypothetical protein
MVGETTPIEAELSSGDGRELAPPCQEWVTTPGTRWESYDLRAAIHARDQCAGPYGVDAWTPSTSPCPATAEPGGLRSEPLQRDRPAARRGGEVHAGGGAGPLRLAAWCCWPAPRGCGLSEACAAARRPRPATAAGAAGQAPGRST